MRKHWWFKHWRLDDFSPNSPMLEPFKVSLHTVLSELMEQLIHLTAYLKLLNQFSLSNLKNMILFL